MTEPESRSFRLFLEQSRVCTESQIAGELDEIASKTDSEQQKHVCGNSQSIQFHFSMLQSRPGHMFRWSRPVFALARSSHSRNLAIHINPRFLRDVEARIEMVSGTSRGWRKGRGTRQDGAGFDCRWTGALCSAGLPVLAEKDKDT
eukprot:2799178-Rhodomonas_salina.2